MDIGDNVQIDMKQTTAIIKWKVVQVNYHLEHLNIFWVGLNKIYSSICRRLMLRSEKVEQVTLFPATGRSNAGHRNSDTKSKFCS